MSDSKILTTHAPLVIPRHHSEDIDAESQVEDGELGYLIGTTKGLPIDVADFYVRYNDDGSRTLNWNWYEVML